MYKEVVNSAGKTLYIVIGGVIAALLVFAIIDTTMMYLDLPYKGIIQLVIIALLTAIVYFLITHEISDYEYFFIENELIFIKKIGSRETPILQLPINEIDFIAPKRNASIKGAKYTTTYNAQKSLFDKRLFIGFFEHEGKRCRLKFEPSDRLLDILYRHGVKILK